MVIRIPKKTKPSKSTDRLVKRNLKEIEILKKRDGELRRDFAIFKKSLPKLIRDELSDILVEERFKRMPEDRKETIKRWNKELDFIPMAVVRTEFKNKYTRDGIEAYFETLGMFKIESSGGQGKKAYWANTLKNKGLNFAMLVKVFNRMSTKEVEAVRDPTNTKGGLNKCNLVHQLMVAGLKKNEARGLAKILRDAFLKNGEPNRLDRYYYKHGKLS